MAFDVSIGQYYENNSVIHRLDPRTKLFFVFVYIIAIFVAKEIYAFALLTAIAILTVVISRVPVAIVLKGLKPVVIIVIFTAILNMFLISLHISTKCCGLYFILLICVQIFIHPILQFIILLIF